MGPSNYKCKISRFKKNSISNLDPLPVMYSSFRCGWAGDEMLSTSIAELEQNYPIRVSSMLQVYDNDELTKDVHFH